jgi:hypothetical protein
VSRFRFLELAVVHHGVTPERTGSVSGIRAPGQDWKELKSALKTDASQDDPLKYLSASKGTIMIVVAIAANSRAEWVESSFGNIEMVVMAAESKPQG